MNILVTGGAGYVGSHVVLALLSKQHKVTVFDNLSTGFKESLPPQVSFILGDLKNKDQIQNALKKNQIEAVFHFAAKLNLHESIAQALTYYQENLTGLIHLLQACEKSQIKHFIFSSSASVYGAISNEPISENAKTGPLNPYAQSKLFCEKIIQDFGAVSKMNYKILRYFNAAGAASNGQSGQRTNPAYHLIHLAAKAALGKNKSMKVYGTDYNTPDGTCVRDYIHIEDLAEMHLVAFEDLVQLKQNTIYNCGYGVGFSVLEVLSLMKKMAPKPFEIEFASRRESDSASLIANTDFFKKSFPHWQPKQNNLEVICRSALNWEIHLSE